MRVPEFKLGLLILLMKTFISHSTADDLICTDTDFNSYLSSKWHIYKKIRPLICTLELWMAFASTDEINETALIPNLLSCARIHVMEIITKGFTTFTLNLDRTIDEKKARSDENVLFSPASITKSLGTIMLVSGGQVFQDLIKVLGLDSGLNMNHSSEVVNRLLSLSIEDYERKHKTDPTYPRCTLSSAIYYEAESLQRKQMSLLNSQIYKGDNTAVYSKLDDTVRSSINLWIENHTENGVPMALANPIDYELPTIIASATTFYGVWHREFVETSRSSFYSEPNDPVEVDTMMTLSTIPFYESESLGLRIAGIPFKEKEVMMYVILPNGGGSSSLKSVKSRLDATVLEDLIANMTEKTRLVILPKLHLTSKLQLRESLRALGLSSLFEKSSANDETSPPLNKRNVSEAEKEYYEYIMRENKAQLGTDQGRESFDDISANEFIHVVNMTVDEKGSEGGPHRGNDDIQMFNVDRPFLFFIRYMPTKSILLWGSIYKP